MPVARVTNSCLVMLSKVFSLKCFYITGLILCGPQWNWKMTALPYCNLCHSLLFHCLSHRCVPQQTVILRWLVYLSDDVVLVETEDKQKLSGFLSHRQSPGFSLCFVVVNDWCFIRAFFYPKLSVCWVYLAYELKLYTWCSAKSHPCCYHSSSRRFLPEHHTVVATSLTTM